MSFKEDYYSYAEQFIIEEEPWEVVTKSKRKNSQNFSDSGSINSHTKPIINVKPFVPSTTLQVETAISSTPKQIVNSNKTKVLKQVIENKRYSPNSKPPLPSANQKIKLDDVVVIF